MSSNSSSTFEEVPTTSQSVCWTQKFNHSYFKFFNILSKNDVKMLIIVKHKREQMFAKMWNVLLISYNVPYMAAKLINNSASWYCTKVAKPSAWQRTTTVTNTVSIGFLQGLITQ